MHAPALRKIMVGFGISLLVMTVLGLSVADVKPAARPVAEPKKEDTTAPAVRDVAALVVPYTETIHAAPKKSTKKKPGAPTLLAVVSKPDIRPRHQVLADAILRALPSNCKNDLKNLFVRYDNPAQRGLGGKTSIILDGSVPDAEFTGLLIHECGHIMHANISGSQHSGESVFRDGTQTFFNDSIIVSFFSISWDTERVMKYGMKNTDFVSGYAKTDAFEDFAETFAAYMLHRDALRAQAKKSPAIAQKLAWMETYLPSTPLPGTKSTVTWSGKAPWDVTRLPYQLSL